MSEKQPNILLIMTDQMRGDCLSLERHPAVLTPNIDAIGGQGAHFRRAYTTCASCIPARRSLLLGQFPATHGVVGFRNAAPNAPAFPRLLRQAGYETVLIGRNMHQTPHDDDYGYDLRNHGSSYVDDDDLAAAIETGAPRAGGMRGVGLSYNGWTARPWPYDERIHPTTWVMRRCREFLAARADERPLFLTASTYAPHPPLLPPAFYMDRYLRMPLPPAAIGDWAERPPNDGLGLGVDSHYCVLEGEALRSAQAGYFGLINHIDDQIYWLQAAFQHDAARTGRPWVAIFTSDHGEMLGDHHMFRKCEPYEGSSRIPLLIRGGGLGFTPGVVCDRPVGLEDIMPTVLELAGAEIPGGVDGRSLLPTLRGEADAIRPHIHCEHAPCYSPQQAYHMLTDGRWKYIWRPTGGEEQLFDLDADPGERHDLAGDPAGADALTTWRGRMVGQLTGRPEGFTDGRKLIAGRPYPPVMDKAK